MGEGSPTKESSFFSDQFLPTPGQDTPGISAHHYCPPEAHLPSGPPGRRKDPGVSTWARISISPPRGPWEGPQLCTINKLVSLEPVAFTPSLTSG